MGRHSAPDDDDEDVVADAAEPVASVLVEEQPPRGRHSAAEPIEPTEPTEPTEPVPTEPTEPVPTEPTEPVPARTKRATNADLRMLRQDPALRARCAAAVVVPFVLYTAVLLVIGRTGVYLLWVWIPTVIAGVVAGAFLDRAARDDDVPATDSEAQPGNDEADDEEDDEADGATDEAATTSE